MRYLPRMERQRRALSQPAGPIEPSGDPALGAVLARALAQAAEPDTARFTHGFHTYPARMHASIARAAIDSLSKREAIVLDPFCGSGTVLVEALVAGRRSIGVDLSPLALRIAQVKCDRRDAASRAAFDRALRAVGAASEARVRARVDARAPIPRDHLQFYDPHVLKELAGLREEILAVAAERDRAALLVVLSSIVVKFSRKRADTAEGTAPKRIRKGLVTEFFIRKGTELGERWAALDAAAPPDAHVPRLFIGDARNLRAALPRGVRADLVVTSPPYGGTYDYVSHHALRYPWLGIDPSELERGEMGSRRNLSGGTGREAEARWDEELGSALRSIAGVAARSAQIVVLLGDAQIGGRRIRASRQLERLAPSAGMRFVAAATQARPDWRDGSPRTESLVAFVRA